MKHQTHSLWHKSKTDLVQLDMDLQNIIPNSKLWKLIERHVKSWDRWKNLPRGKPDPTYWKRVANHE